jgi:hypothetical protein
MRVNLLALSLLSIVTASPALALDSGSLGGAVESAAGAVGGAVEGAAGAVTDGTAAGTAGSAVGSLGGAAAGIGGSAATAVGGTLGGTSPGGIGQAGGAATQAGPSSLDSSGSTGSLSRPGVPGGSSASAGFSSGRTSTVNGARQAAVVRGAPAGFAPLLLPLMLLPVVDSRGDPSVWPLWRAEATGSIRLGPLVSRPGTPAAVLVACRDAIASAARPYGAARVEVASAGRSRRVSDGGLAAPLEARVLYARGGQFQVRRARVSCRLNAAGLVVAAR